MKTISILSFLLLVFTLNTPGTQKNINLRWWTPAKYDVPVINGQAWTDTEDFFDRLPSGAKEKVRDRVWELSKNSAGLTIRFSTNSPEIVVRYKVTGNLAMSHMPATGVSGVDLYAVPQ